MQNETRLLLEAAPSRITMAVLKRANFKLVTEYNNDMELWASTKPQNADSLCAIVNACHEQELKFNLCMIET